MIYKYRLKNKNDEIIYEGNSYQDMIVASSNNPVKEIGFMRINTHKGDSHYIKIFRLTDISKKDCNII
jgi:hypothetical protein